MERVQMQKIQYVFFMFFLFFLQNFLNAQFFEKIKGEIPPEYWKKYSQNENLKDDLVILNDGTEILGKIEHLPPIVYPFASVPFQKKEVAVVKVINGNSPKVRYISCIGEIYTGTIFKKTLRFLKKTKNIKIASGFFHKRKSQQTKYVPIEIELSSIRFIFLKQTEKIPPLTHQDLQSIELNNGDSFQFYEHTYQIYLNKGLKNFSILTREVLELYHMRGSVRGYIKKEGLNEKLDFSLLRDNTFGIRLAKNNQLLHIPWELIYRIKNDNGSMEFSYHAFDFQSVTDKEDMIFIPKGFFHLGSNINIHKELKELPKFEHKTFLTLHGKAQIIKKIHSIPTIYGPSCVIETPAFYIDKYEVSNEEYLKFVLSTEHRKPVHWINGKIPLGKEKHPVVNVSFKDAKKYAEWKGKRLPSEIEWERAAKGATSFPYPYGPQYNPLMSNTESFETVAVGSYERLPLYQIKYPTALMPKTQDMSGNAREWTSTPYSPHYYSNIKKTKIPEFIGEKKRLQMKVVRGGSYKSSAETAKTTFRTLMHEDDFNDFTGFRCAIKENTSP